ncbi:methylmalonyl Co-A mutase-associated GTPase MeaB [bacterium]|nr:methylmalonyl Co-A mutase-associated GTPase MeaB [bacterium]
MRDDSGVLKNDGTINHRKLGRLISTIEHDRQRATELLASMVSDYPSIVIGITGPPGAGKSSLTDGLIVEYRKAGKRVAVIAVDPSSPFSGGAILGDRIRMSSHNTDPEVFIRSMGSRGSLGGLAPASMDVVSLLRNFNFDIIIIETVGVGQSEIDVMKAADTVLLVLVPGMGDDVQALKAGIMEIADIFVVNKADKDGRERLLAELQMIIELNRRQLDWIPPIVETVATERKGVASLVEQMSQRADFVKKNRDTIWRPRVESQIMQMMQEKTGSDILAIFKGHSIFNDWIERILSGELNLYQVLQKIESHLKISWRDENE